MKKVLYLKVDVDTERGTRIGVPNLAALLHELNIPATFLFSLGPDNTGRAIKRVFRRGFLQKVGRTSVVSTYGIRTLLNGVLLPGPHIGKKHADLLREVKARGFEVGIHAYDHQKWQDGVNAMDIAQIRNEFRKAQQEFQRIFGEASKTAGAPGWQANAKTLTVYDEADLLYASDSRGSTPFFPRIGNQVFKTLQIPTTLPTLDELVGREEFPLANIAEHYLSLIREDQLNVMTIHAELEGMKYFSWFREFLQKAIAENILFKRLDVFAKECLQYGRDIPVCEIVQGEVDGRSGNLALQA
jgi:undecaprenyl phosphate-alpha-L-ara4FN deformylase